MQSYCMWSVYIFQPNDGTLDICVNRFRMLEKFISAACGFSYLSFVYSLVLFYFVFFLLAVVHTISALTKGSDSTTDVLFLLSDAQTISYLSVHASRDAYTCKSHPH